MANRQLCSDLLRAKLLGNAVKGCFKRNRRKGSGTTTTSGPLFGKSIGFRGTVPAAHADTSNRSKNGGVAPAKIFNNFGGIQSFFRETKNLISFCLAEMVIFHGDLTSRSRNYGY